MKKELKVKGRKIIALGLIALMLFVPFSSNLGDKMRTMAGEGDTQDSGEMLTMDFEINVKLAENTRENTLKIEGDKGADGGAGAGKEDCLKINRSYENDSYTIKTLSDKLELKLNENVVFNNGKKQLTQSETNKFKMTVKGGYCLPGESEWHKNEREFEVWVSVKQDITYGFDCKWHSEHEDASIKYWKDEVGSPLVDSITISKDNKNAYLWARPQIKEVGQDFTITNIELTDTPTGLPEGTEIAFDWKGEHGDDDDDHDIEKYKKQYEKNVRDYLDENQEKWAKEKNKTALYRQMLSFTYKVTDVEIDDFKWQYFGKTDEDVHQGAYIKTIADDRGTDDSIIRVGEIKYLVVTTDKKPDKSTELSTPSTPTDSDIEKTPNPPTDDMSLWEPADNSYVAKYAKSGYNYGYAGYIVEDSDGEKILVEEFARTSSYVEVDCTPPEIESVGLFLKSKDENNNDVWVELSSSSTIRPINPDTHDYRYVVKVTDAHGVNSSNVVGYSFKDGSKMKNFYFTEDTDNKMGLGETGYYYLDLTNDEDDWYGIITDYGPMSDYNLPDPDPILRMYVYAKDGLENGYNFEVDENRMINPPARKSIYSELSILETYYYLDGKPLSGKGEIPEHTNQELKIEVHVGSSGMINSMELYRNDEETPYKALTGSLNKNNLEDNQFLVTTPVSDNEEDENCFDVQYTFTLPEKDINGETINAIMNNLTLVVKDDIYDQADNLAKNKREADQIREKHRKEFKIADVALDGTVPIFHDYVLVNEDVETPIDINRDLDKWYNATTLKFKASSGKRDEEDYVSLVQCKESLKGDCNDVTSNTLYDKKRDDYQFDKDQEFSIVTKTSQSETGTYIKLEGTDLAGNKGSETFNLKIDNVKPEIDGNQVDFIVNGKATTVKSGALSPEYFAAMPDVRFIASDAITLENCIVKVKYPGEKVFSDGDPIKINKAGAQISVEKTYSIPKQKGKTAYEDGTYTVEIVAVDKAGLISEKCVVSFVLDTKNPVVTLTPITESKKTPNYYSTNTMEVLCTIEDANISYSEFVLVDDYNNKEYVVRDARTRKQDGGYVLAISGQGKHVFTLKGKDLANRKAEDKTMTVYLDNQAPILRTSVSSSVSAVNGDYKAPVTVSYSIEDAYKDENDVTGSITRSIAGNTLENTTNLSRLNRVGAFDAEGDYVVTVKTKDLAGNESAVSEERFRVDLNAPQVQILGASTNTSNNATVSFEMTEAFYKDATAEVVIYRKPGDGVAESEYKKIQMNLTDTTTRQSETLSETGTYRIVMTARDRAGHTSETNAEFTIDKSAPVITIQGVTDFDKKSDAINVNVEIAEDFYVNKTVSIKGTRKIASGKVESLDFTGSFVPGANPTKFVQEFKEDGIYDLTITATDPIGNSTTKTIHFTIDQTKPVIGDLSKYDNKVMNNFTWDIDTDKLVTDLTVCDVHVYLNGIEYDGSEALEDGAYTLLVTAVDELGHESEATANFVIDTKAPVFIITGVKDGEIKNEPYNITISLQLADDILDSVLLNGQSYTIGENNTVTITVNDGGKYELTLHARDAAGNESEEVISFVFGKEKKFNSIFLIAAIAGGILVIGGIIFIILAKRRKEDDRY